MFGKNESSMTREDREFLEELRRDFMLEAEELLQAIVSGLLELEREPQSSSEALERVFRGVHSIKGAAHAVGMPGIASLCQGMEDIFSEMKKGFFQPGPSDFDVLQRGTDLLGDMIAQEEKGSPEALESLHRELEGLLRIPEPEKEKEGFLPPAKIVSAPGVSEAAGAASPPRISREVQPFQGPAASETIRIGASKVDSLVLKAEELIAINLAVEERLRAVGTLLGTLGEWRGTLERELGAKTFSGRSPGALYPGAENILLSEPRRLRKFHEGLRALDKALREDQRMVRGLVRDLLEGTRGVLMMPFSSIFQGFAKLVRDLCRDLGKSVNLELQGDHIEVDKRILEGIRDPLIHLIRNALDHGVEKPGEREQAGKPREAKLEVGVLRGEGNRVEVLIRDDGRGIDPEGLRKKAVKARLLSPEEAEALGDREARNLVFASGISTSPLITDISGRGLGMAIVREKVEALGGKISLESHAGEGTAFRLSLPLTLATFRGVLVREAGQLFVLPSSRVERVFRVCKKEIKHLEQRETVLHNGEPLALVRLGHVLELPELPGVLEEEKEFLTLVVLASGEGMAAFGVQEVLEEQEVLFKPLGKQLERVLHVSGATVLGSGKVVPVLSPGDLLQSITQKSFDAAVTSSEEKSSRKILVAEDSITSRTLLRNVLSAAGFVVRTAVDGKEAMGMLEKEPFDLLVSDVEMPRMNGFELTETLRSTPAFQDLPVVLVTSLESREDRERGARAGADAYIVKSGFDQTHLLEVLRRLL